MVTITIMPILQMDIQSAFHIPVPQPWQTACSSPWEPWDLWCGLSSSQAISVLQIGQFFLHWVLAVESAVQGNDPRPGSLPPGESPADDPALSCLTHSLPLFSPSFTYLFIYSFLDWWADASTRNRMENMTGVNGTTQSGREEEGKWVQLHAGKPQDRRWKQAEGRRKPKGRWHPSQVQMDKSRSHGSASPRCCREGPPPPEQRIQLFGCLAPTSFCGLIFHAPLRWQALQTLLPRSLNSDLFPPESSLSSYWSPFHLWAHREAFPGFSGHNPSLFLAYREGGSLGLGLHSVHVYLLPMMTPAD